DEGNPRLRGQRIALVWMGVVSPIRCAPFAIQAGAHDAVSQPPAPAARRLPVISDNLGNHGLVPYLSCMSAEEHGCPLCPRKRTLIQRVGSQADPGEADASQAGANPAPAATRSARHLRPRRLLHEILSN